ncbi:MAG: hydroxyacid dehydrogenase [Bacteroidia bacterium]|nr:hydroxyacid dehydrogenase [Bacteroidia bacterium]
MIIALIADENHPLLEKMLNENGIYVIRGWLLNEEEFFRTLPYVHILILRSRFRIDEIFLCKAKNLKIIGRVGSGMENIDVARAECKGIKCLSVPEGNAQAVGEHALGMLLCLLRNIHTSNREILDGVWKRKENRGRELSAMQVAIIGYGHTGSAFAEVLKGMVKNVWVYDKYKKGFGDDYIKECSMHEIYENADVVSIHVPYNAETHHLMNKNFFLSFKKNIYVINTSRGKCLCTEDLIYALESGKVLGACLDVHEAEDAGFGLLNFNDKAFQRLTGFKNVVLTPHIAGWTHESNFKMAIFLVKKIKKILHSFAFEM